MANSDAPHSIPVPIKVLDPAIGIPQYALPGDAGADLCTTVDIDLEPGQRQLVPTGIAVAIPQGYVGLIHPRSGLAAREGLSIVNTPGTIDSGYRGEIKVALLNTDLNTRISLKAGDRIAQLVIQPVYQALFEPVDELPESTRAEAGFGSTGGFKPSAS